MGAEGDNAEEWRAVVGWAELYEVSSLGRIRSLHRVGNHQDRTTGELARGRLRKLGWNRGGYPTVVLCRDGLATTYQVHSLVLQAFVGSRPEGMEACHRDGDRKNARLDNLRWDTKAANGVDQRRHRNGPNAQKGRCNRGHLLAEPNLVLSNLRKRNIRQCLSCHRADMVAYQARLRGKPMTAAQKVRRAHANYRKLAMEPRLSDPAA